MIKDDYLKRKLDLAADAIRDLAKGRPALRTDSWRDAYAKHCETARALWGLRVLPPEFAMALYNASAMAARVCNMKPDEATREPFVWEDADDALKMRFAELEVQSRICDAASWGFASGGAAILIGVAPPTPDAEQARAEAYEELDAENPGGEVLFLEVFDRRELRIAKRYGEPGAPESLAKRGKPSHYTISHRDYDQSVEWHESRFVFFGGARTPPKEKSDNQGWDYSILQGLEEDILGFEEAWAEARYMLRRSEQNVISIEGWSDVVGQIGDKLSRARAAEIDEDRDTAHALFLDADKEKFAKHSSNFSSIPELLDRMANKIASGLGVPVTVLMRNSPGGLQATGEVDLKIWYGQVQQHQRNDLYPRALRLGTVIARGLNKAAPKLSFASLWQETKKEMADRQKVVLETDQIAVQYDLLTPQQVAEKRYVDGDFDTPPKIEKVEAIAPVGEPIETPEAVPSDDAAAAKPTPADVPAEGAAQTSVVNPALVLNGAQITAALETARAVKAGEIDRDSGIAILENGFNLPHEKAAAMIGTPAVEKPKSPPGSFGSGGTLPSPGGSTAPPTAPAPRPFPPRPPGAGAPPETT